MLKFILPLLVLLSYPEWLFRSFEIKAIYPFDATHVAPAAAGEARLTEKHVATPDGETLVLWVARPAPGHPVILYLPGNAGNLAVRASRFSMLLDRGFGLVALAYRGSSGSTGRPDEERLSADALMVFDAIPRLVGGPVKGVILYGESLGTAMATKIAAVREAEAVVLQSPFTSMADLAAIQYPDFDLSHLLTQHWDSAALIGDVDEPLLVLHGTADDLVPLKQGEEIYRRAGSRDKKMVKLPGVGHVGMWNEPALKALYRFLDRH